MLGVMERSAIISAKEVLVAYQNRRYFFEDSKVRPSHLTCRTNSY